MLGQRLGEPDQLVAGEIAPPVILAVLLDPFRWVVCSHPPLDGEREHLAQDRNATIGLIGRAGLGNLAMKRVDVLEGDVGDLGVLAEMRNDMIAEKTLIVARGSGTLTGQMLGAETLDQIRDRGCLALRLDLAQGVAAVLDLAAQLSCLVAGGRTAPDRGVADRIGTLPPDPGGVA